MCYDRTGPELLYDYNSKMGITNSTRSKKIMKLKKDARYQNALQQGKREAYRRTKTELRKYRER
jgi:ribosomal protein L21